MKLMNVRELIDRAALALIVAAALSTGCNNGTSASAGPVDETSLRPNGSRKVKVGFGDGTPSTGEPGAAPAAEPTHDQGMMARLPEPPASDMAWTAPSAWTQSPPSSQMRLAQYTIPRVKGDDADAELAVFHLGTAGGGVDETFARWQGTFDDAAVKAAKRTERKAGSMSVFVLEVAGKYRADLAMMAADAGANEPERQGMRLIGAIVMSPSGPYFFKLLGPDKTVAAARDDFLKLLDSCKMNP